jgi:hypothetical protein
MNLVIVLVVAAVAAVALGVYLLAAARRRPAVAVSSARFDEDDGVVSEPVPIERAGTHPLERAPAFERPSPLGDLTGPALDEPELEAEPEREREPELEAEPETAEPLRSATADDAAGAAHDASPVAQPASEPFAPAASSEAVAAPVAAETVPAPEMCWAKRFAPRNGVLDDATRLGVIRDLGLVRAPWGVPLLVEAYDEEPDAAHRRAVLAALALYRHLDARAVFERALRSDDEGERAIAGAALTDLGVTPSLTS